MTKKNRLPRKLKKKLKKKRKAWAIHVFETAVHLSNAMKKDYQKPLHHFLQEYPVTYDQAFKNHTFEWKVKVPMPTNTIIVPTDI